TLSSAASAVRNATTRPPAHAGEGAEPRETSVAWPACCGVRFGAPTEQLLQEEPSPLQSFLGEYDRFRLAARVGDVALLVQAIHRIPVEPLPGPCAVAQPQVEQGKDRLIDLLRVEFHATTPQDRAGINSGLSRPFPKRLVRRALRESTSSGNALATRHCQAIGGLLS